MWVPYLVVILAVLEVHLTISVSKPDDASTKDDHPDHHPESDEDITLATETKHHHERKHRHVVKFEVKGIPYKNCPHDGVVGVPCWFPVMLPIASQQQKPHMSHSLTPSQSQHYQFTKDAQHPDTVADIFKSFSSLTKLDPAGLSSLHSEFQQNSGPQFRARLDSESPETLDKSGTVKTENYTENIDVIPVSKTNELVPGSSFSAVFATISPHSYQHSAQLHESKHDVKTLLKHIWEKSKVKHAKNTNIKTMKINVTS